MQLFVLLSQHFHYCYSLSSNRNVSQNSQMPTSAFKSSSKKPNSSTTTTTTTKSSQSGKVQRSRSVSRFSRTQLDITSEFHNKTDNPLFWVDDNSPLADPETEVKLAKFDEICSKLSLKGSGSDGGESRRGRSVSRNSIDGGRKGFGRSLSRVHNGRLRRSPSSWRSGKNSESEKEIDLFSELKSKSKISSNAYRKLPAQKNKLARSASDLSEVLKGWNTWSSQHPASETSDDSANSLSGSRIPHSDDVKSASINSEAEEKTIRSVSKEKKIGDLKVDNVTTGGILETVRTEVRRAISDIQHDSKNLSVMLRSDSDINDSSILSEIALEMGNLNEVEFMRNIRGDYLKELEECEERTRKLRAELAAEQYRELELNTILGDINPEPKTPQVQKPHPLSKASLERRKMSRRLEEEAMAYFDECVSISTFDDSDFSSLEDPPSTVFMFRDPGDEIETLPGASGRVIACPFESQDLSRQSLLSQCDECSSLLANSGLDDDLHTNSLNVKTKSHFSFSSKSSGTNSFEQDVRSHVKNFSKDRRGRNSSGFQTVSSGHQNTRDFTCPLALEKFLLDRMNFRSRIESGGMLLCGGGFGFSTALF